MNDDTAAMILTAIGGAVAFETRARPLFASMLDELRQHRREDAMAHGLTHTTLGEQGTTLRSVATKLAAIFLAGVLLVRCFSTVTRDSAAMIRSDLERFGELSAPAPGVDREAWERARASLARHLAELEERAR